MAEQDTKAADFSALAFTNRPGHPMGEQATMFFPNGYGVSVIRGPHSYGGPSGLYELAVLAGSEADFSLTYDTPVTDDVEGHLSPTEVSMLMAQVEALPAVEA